MNSPGAGADAGAGAGAEGHESGVFDELSFHVVSGAPTCTASGQGIQRGRQEQKPLFCRNLSDVTVKALEGS